MSGTGTFVAKRFLRAFNGDAVNTDHIVRIYQSADGHVFANLTNGADIQLATDAHTVDPLPALPRLSFVEVG